MQVRRENMNLRRNHLNVRRILMIISGPKIGDDVADAQMMNGRMELHITRIPHKGF
jgi:hypothetical protein